jgi:hypothetical protein
MKTRWAALVATAVANAAIIAIITPIWGVKACGDVMLGLILFKAGLFVALYGWRSNWRATAAGQAVMALIGCIFAVAGVAALGAWLGPTYPGRTFVRLSTFVAVGLVLMNMLVTLISAQNGHSDPRDRRDE